LIVSESLRDIHVDVDDNLTIKAEIKHALHLKCIDITRRDISNVIGPTQSRDLSRDETSVEPNIRSRDFKMSTTTQSHDEIVDIVSRDEIFFLSRESVGKLNDVLVVQSCVTSLMELRERYRDDCGSKFKLAVLAKDLFLFPVVCLRSGLVDEVCYIGLKQTQRSIVHRLLDLNGIDLGRVLFLNHCSECPTRDYQVVWVDIIDSGGPMLQNILEDLVLARLTHLLFVFVVLVCNITAYQCEKLSELQMQVHCLK